MKLLLDQNLSHRLVGALESSYAGSIHVRDIGLASASDDVVWSRAQQHGLMIVTKDADFHQMSLLKGHPPKVVWIRRGNCSTAEIEEILRTRRADLEAFDRDPVASLLTLD